MASEWPTVKIGDVCNRVTKGTTPTTLGGRFTESGISFIKVESISDDGNFLPAKLAFIDTETDEKLSRSRLQEDDILFTIAGTIGRVAQVPRSLLPGNTNQAVAIVRPNSELVQPRFLYYILRDGSRIRLAQSRVVQSVQANFSLGELSAIEMPLPSLEEQSAITEILGALDDRIHNLRQTNATLQAIAAALFKSRFVDFDGVLPENMQESELGLIPKGWRPFTFGEIATLGKGSVTPTSQPQTVFKHYSLPAFDAGQMPNAETGEAIKSNKTPVPSDAVLVSKLNPHIPRIWFVGDAGANAVCSTEFLVWTPKPGIGSAFVYFAATSSEFNSTMRQLVTGTSNSHQRVKPDQLANAHAAIASKEAIAAFDEAAAPLLQKIEDNRQQASTLATLRDTLLPRLISGRLRVADVERIEETA